jgi:hypothetical protein
MTMLMMTPEYISGQICPPLQPLLLLLLLYVWVDFAACSSLQQQGVISWACWLCLQELLFRM